MISSNVSKCPNCRGDLKYYDKVKRMIRIKGGIKKWTYVKRFRCVKCNCLHREIPEYIKPYKHYISEIIEGFLNGTITSDSIDYEDYPCEMTTERWYKSFIRS